MSKLRQRISDNLFNIPGWRTKRRIVIFESDDWGSIRMPSRDVYNTLLKAGIRVDKCPFCSFDSLATEDDLTSLFGVLRKFKDKNGNHPVFTANCVVANPDFLKISETDFNEYHFELFTETLKRYPGCKNSFSLWKQGINERLFFPQFHGREHVNVNRWMKSLSDKSPEQLLAFQNNMFGISSTISSEGGKSYMAAFDADNNIEIESHKHIVNEGLTLFISTFGFKPTTFVAPNFICSEIIEKHLASLSFKFIKSSKVSFLPLIGNGYKKRRLFMGQKNSFGQIYIVRNCLFEPSFFQNTDWVSSCLRNIKSSFLWDKPAIIGTHRVNYIGSINEKNRKNNLRFLTELLTEIIKKWPEVEFLNSEQLGALINSNEKSG